MSKTHFWNISEIFFFFFFFFFFRKKPMPVAQIDFLFQTRCLKANVLSDLCVCVHCRHKSIDISIIKTVLQSNEPVSGDE